MAKERKASVIYEGNASQLVYAFPFDYLRKKFVKVEDLYTNITELTIGVDYTVEDKQVRLVKGIPLGHSVKIYRETTTAPLVEWQDASVLRSADLSLQEVQLLHLAEETADKVFDSGMSTAYDNPNCWDGQYKRIINALDPIEDGDVVTLRYIKAKQDSLLNQLKNTGAAQNSSIVATGNTQNKRLTDTGNAYVSTMTTLKDTATIKANDASNSAALSKKWAVSSMSPDGATASKSSKTWAEEAKVYAYNSSTYADASQDSATTASTYANKAMGYAEAPRGQAPNGSTSAKVWAEIAGVKANSASSSASEAASSASGASTSAFNAKMSETNAAKSASAAAQSAIDAAKFDPSTYYTKNELPEIMLNIFYPVGTVYMSADTSKTKADFPFMQYGTWIEIPPDLCLQTGSASEAGTQREAGLPNITGKRVSIWGGADSERRSSLSGCFKAAPDMKTPETSGGESYLATGAGFIFDASLSNPIYGKSDTVQPPAYMVRAWVRTV